MSPVSSVAASSLVSAYGRFETASSRMVQAAGGGSDDLEGAVVELNEAKSGVRAATAVMRTADEMTGVLLDMLA